jgi:hypothetical protein
VLLEYHLIDQFQFWIFPVRVGRGGAWAIGSSTDGPDRTREDKS